MTRRRTRIPGAFRALARIAEQAGCSVAHTRSGHLRWTAPDGAVVVTASTPSCRRGSLNARARLRRAGLKETP